MLTLTGRCEDDGHTASGVSPPHDSDLKGNLNLDIDPPSGPSEAFLEEKRNSGYGERKFDKTVQLKRASGAEEEREKDPEEREFERDLHEKPGDRGPNGEDATLSLPRDVNDSDRGEIERSKEGNILRDQSTEKATYQCVNFKSPDDFSKYGYSPFSSAIKGVTNFSHTMLPFQLEDRKSERLGHSNNSYELYDENVLAWLKDQERGEKGVERKACEMEEGEKERNSEELGERGDNREYAISSGREAITQTSFENEKLGAESLKEVISNEISHSGRQIELKSEVEMENSLTKPLSLLRLSSSSANISSSHSSSLSSSSLSSSSSSIEYLRVSVCDHREENLLSHFSASSLWMKEKLSSGDGRSLSLSLSLSLCLSVSLYLFVSFF
jgi:hypothetical protein